MTDIPTRFGLVRHGQTDANLRNQFQGVTDNPLNATGIQQAHHALDAAPADIRWDVVISSDMQRAERTGRIIAEDHGIPFGGTDARLREIDWGIAEGVEVDHAVRRWPDRNFPGREDGQAVADRAAAALRTIAAQRPGENVLIAAHGTLIRLLITGILGEAIPSIPNGSYSEVVVDGSVWTVTAIAGETWSGPARTVPPTAFLPLPGDHLTPRQPANADPLT